MPDFSMFGAESYVPRLVEQDRLANLAKAATIGHTFALTQESFGRIAMQPAEIRRMEAQAGKAEMETAREKAYFEALQRMSSGQPEGRSGQPEGGAYDPLSSLADKLGNQAEILSAAGFPKKAADLAEKASLIHLHGAQRRAQETLQNERLLKTETARVDLAVKLINSVYDERSAADAEQQYGLATGQSLYGGRPWSKDLNDYIREQQMSYKDRLTITHQALRDRVYESNIEDLQRHRRTTEQIQKDNLDLARQREKRISATVGKSAARPSQSDIKSAANFLDQNMTIEDPNNKYSAAEALASRTNIILRTNPGLDIDEARNRAFVQGKQAGDFNVVHAEGFKILGKEFGGKTKGTFVGGGKTPESPLAIPLNKEGRADPASLMKGRYYLITDTAGRAAVGQWTGKGFRRVGDAPGEAAAPVIEEAE